MNHQKGSFAPAYELAGDRFVIRGFDRAPAFTSFLPGIAGRLGIPLWAYTVNRAELLIPGPRTFAGVEKLAAVLHPPVILDAPAAKP